MKVVSLISAFVSVMLLSYAKVPPQEMIGICLLIISYDFFMHDKKKSIAHL
jgi:hypothetical protein